MKLTPLINGTEVQPASVVVQANKEWVAAVEARVTRVLPLAENITAENLSEVVSGTREMQSVIKEIEAEEKLAVAKIKPTLEAIKELARQVARKPKAAYDLLTARLGAYYEKEQAKKAAAEIERMRKEAAEAETRRQAAAAAEAERQKLLAAERAAQDQEAQKKAIAEREAFEAAQELAACFPEAEPEFQLVPVEQGAPIPGARVTKRWKYTLVDPIAAYNFNKQLLKIQLLHNACEDVRRIMDERGLAFEIPGVEITTYNDVSATGAAQISYE